MKENEYYFSEKEKGILPPIGEEIPSNFWEGFISFFHKRLADGSFAEEFPRNCLDAPIPVECDEKLLELALKAEFPDIKVPLNVNDIPNDLEILDLIEFFQKYISKPVDKKYHDYFSHYHLLSFDRKSARAEYQTYFNKLFRRNNLAYELKSNGEIIRLGTPIVRGILLNTIFNSEDDELNSLLEKARNKFLDPDIEMRKEAIEKLWDAWERLKTIENKDDKKQSVRALLERAILLEEFRDYIDNDAKSLTEIGNNFKIRHTEINKPALDESAYLDYLFHRLFSLIWLLMSLTNRIKHK